VNDRPRNGFVAVSVVATVVFLAISRLQSSVYNNDVLLASAFAHGRAWIDWPGAYIDAVLYHGRHYVIEGPVPALLLLPSVLVWGTKANQTTLACLSAGVAVGAAWLVARRAGATNARALAIAAFFAFGTSLAWCAMYGAVWFVAHTVAAMFATLAVAETLGRRRLWLVTLLLVLAAGSRSTLALAIVPLGTYAFVSLPRAERRTELAKLAAVVVPAAVAYVAYDEARWGTPNDPGYLLWYHADQMGETTGSPFRLSYLSYELDAFFKAIPQWTGAYPWFKIDYSAVAIEITSPALALAAFARGERRLVAALVAAIVLEIVPSLLYYADGGIQFGMRHALDFEPFVLPLLALASRRMPAWVTFALCLLSVAVGIWGLWYWRTFYDALLVH
jgi:hypothetical protein